MPPDVGEYVEQLDARSVLDGIARMDDAHAAALAEEGCGPAVTGPARTWADFFWYYRRLGLRHEAAAEAARQAMGGR